jgi:hypothetical protein
MNLSISSKNIDYLTNNFKEAEFKLLETGDSNSITCFVCIISDTKLLQRIWEGVASSIALNFQNNLDDNFSIWNIYLVFISTKKIEENLKYKIENDKFSMRKMLFDESNLTCAALIKKLNDEILGNDLKLHSDYDKKIADNHPITVMQSLIEEHGEILIGSKENVSKYVNELIKYLISRTIYEN